jgi:hypothetical protein
MLKKLRACSAGSVAVSTALVFSALFGSVGVGVEISHWYQLRRSMQGAADTAAVSAAWALPAGGPCGASCVTEGKAVAAMNGWQDGVKGVSVSVISPPVSPSRFAGNANAVEVKITQQQSLMFGRVLEAIAPKATIAAPNVGAFGVAIIGTTTTTTVVNGTDCVLALANAANAVQVDGNGDLKANCGIAIDGGRDQNVSGTPLGGITFNGNNAKVNISSLVVAASTTSCPGSHCFLFNPTTTALPSSAIKTNTATLDPLASTAFPTPPNGVNSVSVTNQGSGFTNGTRTFTLSGGTFTSPAKFTVTVSGGKVTGTPTVIDPGIYTVMPALTNATATPDTGGGTGAKFTIAEGCFTWSTGGTPLPGRKYCSINLNGSGTTNFPTGSYYVAGGDANCIGFCVSSANATVTSDQAGVTFYLTNGEGSGTFGTSSYAHISVSSGNVTLCAPGTACGTGCTGSCLLFVQNPAATASTANGTPASTNNTFSGNGTRLLSGLIYLPKQTLTVSGNSTIGGCVGLIAKYIDVGGTPTFSNGCLPGTGIGGSTTTTTTTTPPALSE